MKLWGKKESGGFDYGLLGADMHSHLIPGSMMARLTLKHQ
jgi:hypothetical protein